MFRCLLCMLLMLTCCKYAGAQGRYQTIQGAVTDSITGTVLEQASVTLVLLPGTSIIKQVLMGKKGFLFQKVPAGDYILVGNHIGYQTYISSKIIRVEDSMPPFQQIRMVPSVDLIEVVVKSTIPPVIVKSDTLVYNAGAFRTNPYATVEEFLEKLPGIEVDKSGNILANGKKVEKILIDGKEIFLKDLKMITRNLTADILAQVEIMNTKSDFSKFSGVPDMNPGKTVNLKLKKDKKLTSAWALQGGFGTAQTHLFEAKLINFLKDPLVVATAGSSGDKLKQENSMNFHVRKNIGKKVTLSLSNSLTKFQTNQLTYSKNETFVSDTTVSESKESSSLNTVISNNISQTTNWAIDSLNKVSVVSAFSYLSNNGEFSSSSIVDFLKPPATYTVSKGVTVNGSGLIQNRLTNSIMFQHRFYKPGRMLTITISNMIQRKRNHTGLNTRLSFLDPANGSILNTVIDQKTGLRNKEFQSDLRIQYAEPIGKRQAISVEYQQESGRNNTDNKGYRYNPITGFYDITDTITTHDFTKKQLVRNLILGYNLVAGRLRYQLGMSANIISMMNQNNATGVFLESKSSRLNPQVAVMLELSKSCNMNIKYTVSGLPPEMEQLQPLTDLTNPFFIQKGNPWLVPGTGHGLKLELQSANTKKFRSLWVLLDAAYVKHAIVPDITIFPSGVQQYQYINASGPCSVSVNANYNFLLGADKQAKGDVETFIGYRHDLSFMNKVETARNDLILRKNLGVRLGFSDKFFMTCRAGVEYTISRYSSRKELNTQFLAQQYFSDITWLLPSDWRITSDCFWQIDGEQHLLPGNSSVMWNAALSKKIFNKRQGEISLQGKNILDNVSSFMQFRSENQITTYRSNILGKIFRFSFSYKFGG